MDDEVERVAELRADRLVRQTEAAISASVSTRRSASAGDPAWTVDSEPSCPVAERGEHVVRFGARGPPRR